MAIKYDLNRQCYVAQIGSGKLGTRKKKHFQLKREAEYWVSEQIQKFNDPDNNYVFNGEAMVSNMIDQYLVSLKDRTSSHQRAVKTGIHDVLKYIDVIYFKDLTTQRVHRFRNCDTQSPRTINKKLGFVKSMCKHLYNEGWISNDPMRSLQKKKAIKREKRALDQSEMSELLKTLKRRSPDIWFPLIYTGFILALRKGELMTLEWSDIDWNNKSVHIRDKPHIKIEGQPHFCKWGSSRTLPLFPELEKLLSNLKKTSNFIFPTKTGKLRWNNVNRDFPKAIEEANIDRIKEITPHTLRHTRISQLICYEKQNPLKVKEFAGHKNIATTWGYAHLLGGIEDMIHANKSVPNFEDFN